MKMYNNNVQRKFDVQRNTNETTIILSQSESQCDPNFNVNPNEKVRV